MLFRSCDPVYPVYVDSNVMAGRAGEYDPASQVWSNVIYMPCTAENDFVPELPKETPDLIYLCFPNNPTGAAVSRSELQEWVDTYGRAAMRVFATGLVGVVVGASYPTVLVVLALP